MGNEKRLIDANEARKHSTHDFITHFLDRCPTVDAVEVVHGRWKVARESEISKEVWCTACGEGFYLHKKNTVPIDKMPYCPNCGAKMDGERK